VGTEIESRLFNTLMFMKAKLLDQFKTTACESLTESRRSAGEERREPEDRSSGIGVPQ
jgi:hypothetical protein